MIESHQRAGDKPMEQHLHIRDNASRMFPSFMNADLGLWTAIVSLIIVLLPGILAKFMAFKEVDSSMTVQNPFLSSPSFLSSTLIIGFILAIIAIASGKSNPSARLLATFTLVVCVVRFLLPS